MTAAPFLHPGPVRRETRLTLGMAQLAYRGLAEDWWLRHLGDVHWQLIADAVGQHSTVFRDAAGRQIYAAFCATEFEQLDPEAAALGSETTLCSELWAVARSRLQSVHRLVIGGQKVARMRLISTFVTHLEQGVNASVCRANPYLLPVLPQAPDGFAERSSALAKAQRADPRIGTPKLELHPCTGSDFNAVGLLYFPSYTRLFEQAAQRLDPRADWRPVRRRCVTYFSNIETGETVHAAQMPDSPGHLALWRQGSGEHPAQKMAQSLCERF
ncbi:Pnap_2097 family protein [Dinoroseobacter sp. S375]|uniref:Pnap_2097 family protein n=1 Tax=Dinoroseobacter sp. S375 TaxID=3415136 RepID=UPI003C79B6ED